MRCIFALHLRFFLYACLSVCCPATSLTRVFLLDALCLIVSSTIGLDADPWKGRESEQLFPYGIYTIPEVSMIGKTEAQLTAEGVSYEVRSHRQPPLRLETRRNTFKIMLVPRTICYQLVFKSRFSGYAADC